MAKEIMLLENVEGLGDEGDIVQVAEGYARNYLLPQNLAAPVTNATRKFIEKRERERKGDEKERLKSAKELAAKLEQVSCTIPVKTGKDDKLFGGVNEGHILKAIENQGIELDKNLIVIDAPIDNLGIFEFPVKLHPDVVVALKVWVVKE